MGMWKTKWIGSADYGYVNIPSDWKKNDSIQVGDNIQYTDKKRLQCYCFKCCH